MLCVIFNTKEENVKWKFDKSLTELERWAAKNRREGEEVKYISTEEESTDFFERFITNKKFFSFGRKK